VTGTGWGPPPEAKLPWGAGRIHSQGGHFPAGDDIQIAPLRSDQRPDIEQLLRSTGFFRDDEIVVALEVIDAHFARPGQEYHAVGAFTPGGELLGYACWGPTPCTSATWDLYWIAVAPGAQRRGVGTRLLQEVERRLVHADARLVLVETSALPHYDATQRFYRSSGYEQVARVPDFYAAGDDKLIFAKRIHRV
jgi:ribosomal protein S18 acetylase RimI-like enzyme